MIARAAAALLTGATSTARSLLQFGVGAPGADENHWAEPGMPSDADEQLEPGCGLGLDEGAAESVAEAVDQRAIGLAGRLVVGDVEHDGAFVALVEEMLDVAFDDARGADTPRRVGARSGRPDVLPRRDRDAKRCNGLERWDRLEPAVGRGAAADDPAGDRQLGGVGRRLGSFRILFGHVRQPPRPLRGKRHGRGSALGRRVHRQVDLCAA